ncbi:MAG: PQQ-binding-like beta-propeller repeat protein [Sandaracinaceae bacterium]|nr:PQQ-binding-like beta-propeller repeat protein [Sandaracinaceae bacterium]
MFREAADDRPILVVAGEGTVTGYERLTGKQVWRHEIRVHGLFGEARSFSAIDIAIHGGRVYALSSSRILCVDYLTGAPLGQVDLSGVTSRPSLLVDGDLIFVGQRDGIYCYGLDGQLRWSVPHDGLSREGPALGLPGNIRQMDDTGRE